MSRYLVTGGAGFLGSHLVDALIKKGQVVVLDNLFRGNSDNLKLHLDKPSFSFIKGDILKPSDVNRAIKDVDVVFHLAAINGTRYFYERPLEVLSVNAVGTKNVLDAAFDHQVKTLVFASTSEVYGHSNAFPTPETARTIFDAPTVTKWSYAVSKLYGEHLCLAYYKSRDLPIVILRYFNTYGPRLIGTPYGQVVSMFINRLIKGKKIEVYGNGEQTRSFAYVEDTIRATVRASEVKSVIGEVLNIGSQEEVSINQLAFRIAELMGKKPEKFAVHKEALEGDVRRRLPDLSKAKRLLGFRPRVSLEEGLKKTIDWFRRNTE